MDTDVLFHGNFNFIPNKIRQKKNGSWVFTDGVRLVAIYLIHKNFLNAVENIQSRYVFK